MKYVVFTVNKVYGTYNDELAALDAAKAHVLEMDPQKYRPDQVWIAKSFGTVKRSATVEGVK